MEVISPSHVIETPLDGNRILKNLERYGRTAYKSEDKITEDSAKKFIKSILSRGHESILEHESITVRFICDRGVTHELVRHRLCAFTQESTRYCNYTKKGMQVIKPPFWQQDSPQYKLWYATMQMCEKAYNDLIANGATPQEARSVLPNSLKTEIVTSANIREWRHILTLRTSKAAHPQMRELMIGLLTDFQQKIPVLFEDINTTLG